ncbi:MAG: non-canonical purine NTP pyrophosphatase, partial [Candidatus Eremiobacteraeota bacterium]|nr:non-canonical purine NTP pyrophosphatase [Candidatus Eremiobacteraeota bacterium]
IFFYPPEARTFAQLGEARKNRVSHRFHAAQALIAALSR